MSRPHQRPISEWTIRPRVWVPVLLLCGSLMVIAQALPKIPRNPRSDEVQDAARPVLEAIRRYRTQHDGAAPEDLGALLAFMGRPLPDGRLPLDPWGHPLGYVKCDTEYGCTYVTSFGADDCVGSWGEDQDVWVFVDVETR